MCRYTAVDSFTSKMPKCLQHYPRWFSHRHLIPYSHMTQANDLPTHIEPEVAIRPVGRVDKLRRYLSSQTKIVYSFGT